MNLETLIQELEKLPHDKIVKHGFGSGHSWRGSYCEAAFSPKDNVTIGEMLSHAKELLGSTQTGWKGGEYVMHPYCDVYIAHEGDLGEPINSFNLMVWRG